MPRPPRTRRDFLQGVATAGSAALLGGGGLLGCASPNSSGKTGRVVHVRLQESEQAFANPLKGFRTDLPSDGGDGTGLKNPLISLTRHYIRWNQIEDSADDPVDKILEFCNPRWAGLEQKNIKVIPRVYLYWPEKYYWPRDLKAGDYTSTAFLERTAKFIHKIAEAWDNDSRVAYVETGIVGPCGEQWGPKPSPELRKVMGDAYTAAFRHTLCMIRYPWEWPDYQFGVFWDSWGTHKDTDHMLQALDSAEWSGSWKTRVRGGEISYGFGDPPGVEPTDTLTSIRHVEWVECLARRYHSNHLGWVSEYDWRRPEARANGERLQKTFGYRFVLGEATYPKSVMPGETLDVTFTVKNTGSTPFYYQWPVAVSLMDEQTRRVVWQAEFQNLDIRQWLPGDRWQQFAYWNSELYRYVLDSQPARYQVPAETHRVTGSFILPANLRRGNHVLALSVLDPAGHVPACRFANINYFTGGYHPLGRIGIGVAVNNPELAPSLFDNPAHDTSLGYSLAKNG